MISLCPLKRLLVVVLFVIQNSFFLIQDTGINGTPTAVLQDLIRRTQCIFPAQLINIPITFHPPTPFPPTISCQKSTTAINMLQSQHPDILAPLVRQTVRDFRLLQAGISYLGKQLLQSSLHAIEFILQ